MMLTETVLINYILIDVHARLQKVNNWRRGIRTVPTVCLLVWPAVSLPESVWQTMRLQRQRLSLKWSKRVTHKKRPKKYKK